MATRNNDPAHLATDLELEALERRIASVYNQAAKDIQPKIDAFFDRFREQDEAMKKKLEAGEINKYQYQNWRKNQLLYGERFKALQDALAERMTKANEVAAAYINDTTPGVYSLNRNYAAYTVEKVGGNVGFTLWDESTVRRLLKEQPGLMPFYPEDRAIQRGIDLAFGRKKILEHITSGILRGQSIPDIAKDLRVSLPGMNRASAIRAARTAMTGAQNGGRMDSYKAAANMGLKIRKRWVATKDDRTRKSHRDMDGETVDWDEKFSNGLMYPGDPSGPERETYNCRCTMRTVEKAGIEAEPRQMRVQSPEYTKAIEAENREREKLDRLNKQIAAEKDPDKLSALKDRKKKLQKNVAELTAERKATKKNVVVSEMTYAEWERWVKIR